MATVDWVDDITTSSSNIMGPAPAKDRKKVTTETFNHRFTNKRGTKTSLGQADIICIQEMPVKPDGNTAKEYLPFIDSHTAVYTRESGRKRAKNEWVKKSTKRQGKYNAVYFKKEKFKQIKKFKQIEHAFRLMKIKRNIYDEIKRKGIKKQAEQGKLQPWGENDDEIEMCEEVLAECNELGFKKAISRFMEESPETKSLKTKSPKRLLNKRMAIQCLKLRSNPNYRIVVISVHNYSTGSGKEAPANFAYLFFDFLAKLKVPVLIAGDFNLDITKEPSLTKYIRKYSIEEYEMRPLRKKIKRKNQRIDFILLGNGNGDSFKTSLHETEAHDLQVPSKVRKKPEEITNHNPLSATLTVKTKKWVRARATLKKKATPKTSSGCK